MQATTLYLSVNPTPEAVINGSLFATTFFFIIILVITIILFLLLHTTTFRRKQFQKHRTLGITASLGISIAFFLLCTSLIYHDLWQRFYILHITNEQMVLEYFMPHRTITVPQEDITRIHITRSINASYVLYIEDVHGTKWQSGKMHGDHLKKITCTIAGTCVPLP